MAEQWPIVDALLGGTPAMRKAGPEFLPQFPNEEGAAYRTRLGASTLYPAFRRTVTVMAGKPFSKALTLGEDVPKRIQDLCENVDREGRNLHVFGRQLASEALSYGLCGILADHPDTTGMRTLADQQQAGSRPYLVFIRHDQILGWKAATVGGQTRLTQLRLAESAEVDDGGGYGTVQVNRVRVLEPGKWELWEEAGEDGTYTLIGGGTTSIAVIPFAPVYGEQTGFMTGKSPLLDLAYLNVKHWQSQSDQDNITHVARVPILFTKGFPDEKSIVVGASAAVKTESTEADMKFVEHTGAAIKAGVESLKDLEQQMVQTGAELLVVKPGQGQRSATEANNDAEGNKSDLQSFTESWEDSLDQALQFLAMWSGEAEGGHVSLFKDFGAATLTDASAQLVLAMHQGGLITKATAIRELQRRGMIAADVDPEDELAQVELEGPPLGTIEADPGGNPDDDTPGA